MRIQLMSDLHCEWWYRNHGEGWFFKELEEKMKDVGPIPDVLVLAGDIVTRTCAEHYLKRFASLYPQVVYVAGNHEFYGSRYQQALNTLAGLKIPNLHWLENKTIELGGKRFVGSTLWFCEADVKRAGVRENWLNDFYQIQGDDQLSARDWMYAKHEEAKKWLWENVQPGDIVVTHHLPTYEVVAPRWRASNQNCFFASNQLDTIHQKKPALWLYGHTHDSCDQVVGSTRCVANPFGYFEMEVNSNFDFSFIIDV